MVLIITIMRNVKLSLVKTYCVVFEKKRLMKQKLDGHASEASSEKTYIFKKISHNSRSSTFYCEKKRKKKTK